LLVIGGFSALIYWGLLPGAKLQTGEQLHAPNGDTNKWKDFINGLVHNVEHPLALLLAQTGGIKTALAGRDTECIDIGEEVKFSLYFSSK